MALVLQTVLEHGPVSKAQIARLTGLSKSSVGSLVTAINALRPRPLLIEQAVVRGGVGRPATELALDPLAVSVLGAAVYVDRVELVRLGLGGEVTLRQSVPWTRDRPLTEVLDALRDQAAGCLAVGVACPGIVDLARGRVELALELQWEGLDLGPEIRQAVGLPAVVMNRSLAGAYGEAHRTGIANLLHVTVATDVGAGVVVQGKGITGHRHQAGELGHVAVRQEGGHLCRCGQRGCLEAEVSCGAVQRRLEEAGLPTPSACGYASLAQAERTHPAPAQALRHEVVRDLARGLTVAIRLLDPEAILIEGHLAHLGSSALSELRAVLWETRLGPGDLPTLRFSEADPAAGVGLYTLHRLASDLLIYGDRPPARPTGPSRPRPRRRSAPAGRPPRRRPEPAGSPLPGGRA